MNATQDMNGGRSFPSRKTSGFGEMGTEIEINTQAPYGNKKLVSTPFVQNQGHAGSSQPSAISPQECSTRSVRVGDPGPGFGHGALPPLEIAGSHRSLPKKFLNGGQSS